MSKSGNGYDIGIVFGGDLQPLYKSLQAASARLSKFTSDSTSALASLASSFAKYGGIISGVGVSAFGFVAYKAAETAVEIEKLSKELNVSSNTLQVWAKTGRRSGVELSSIAAVIRDLNKNLGEFETAGSGPLKDFFDRIGPRIGVTVEDFKRLSGTEGLQFFYNSLQKAGLSTQEITGLMQKMSGSAKDVLPLLEDSGKALGEMAEQQKKWGTVLNETDITALKTMSQSFAALKDSVMDTLNKLSAAIAPELNALANVFRTMVDKIRLDPEKIKNMLLKGIGGAFEMLAKTFQFFESAIRKLDKALASIPKINWQRIFDPTELEALEDELAHKKDLIDDLGNSPRNNTIIKVMTEQIGELETKITALKTKSNSEGWFAEFANNYQGELSKVLTSNEQAAAQLADANAQKSDNIALGGTKPLPKPQVDSGVQVDPILAQEIAQRQQFHETLTAINSQYAIKDWEARIAQQEQLLLLEETHQQQMAVLKSLESQGDLARQAENHALQLAAEEEYEKRRTEILEQGLNVRDRMIKWYNSAAVQTNMSAMSSLIGALDSGNKKQFNLQKNLSLAQAAVALPSAVLKAFDGGGGAPYGFIPAGITAAAGLLQINKIKSARYDGGGSSGASASADTGASAASAGGSSGGQAAQSIGSVVKVAGFKDDHFYSGDRLNSMVGAIAQYQRNGTNVIF